MIDEDNWTRFKEKDRSSHPPENVNLILYSEELKEFGLFLGYYTHNETTNKWEFLDLDVEVLENISHWQLAPNIPKLKD
jgi:hypothetical protein